jgi:hypothetical protein
MNILDENIIASQRQRLRSWRVRVRQIGVDIAGKGRQDEEILPLSADTIRSALQAAVAVQAQVHASVRRGVARGATWATACCTNSVGS